MIKVKVCGITTYEDARLALDHGVDALGFNLFAGSPRRVTPECARSIVERLPVFAVVVGVFVNEPEPRAIASLARVAGMGVLQLHGDETPEYCRALQGWPVIKALRVGGDTVGLALEDFRVRAFLLDSRDETAFGGTGRTFNWAAAEAVKPYGPVIVAGGLSSANVGAAIRKIRPYGVDVCSGVEAAPGRKDPRRLEEFMQEVRNCE